MKHFCNFFSNSEKIKKNLKTLTVGFAFLLTGYNNVNAQVSTYSFTQSGGTYTNIGAGTVLATATGNTSATNLNNGVYPINLPFGFAFNGVSYTSLNVSANGFVTFGTTAPATSVTSPINSTTAFDGAISAFGRDLSSVFDIAGVTGNISWDVVGAIPNREVVIQWKNFRPNSAVTATAAYTFSFQIRLKETSNVINVIYDSGSNLIGAPVINGTCQVGLRGTSTTDFNSRLNSTALQFINSTSGTASSSTQAYDTTNAVPGMPSAGLTYAWTPPSCYLPTNGNFSTIGSDTAVITWNASASSPSSGYDIYYSTNNIAPTSTTTPTLTNQTGISATLNNLIPLTTYYIWIRSNCGSGNTSIWSLLPIQITTLCQPPVLLSTLGETVCPNSTATLSATTGTGSTIKWYDASTGGNLVATGTNFTTPALTNTTSYYASAASGIKSNVGPVSPGILTNSAASTSSTTYYIEFEVTNSPMTLLSTDVFPNTAGSNTTLEILRGPTTFTIINTISFTSTLASNGVIAQTVPINVVLTPGVYRMRISGGSYFRNYPSNATFPYSVPNFSITGGSNSATNSYYYMYNLQVSSGCESPRTMVTATVDAGCLSTSEIAKIDAIKVYPNPFTEVVNITKSELVKSVSVMDVSGKLMIKIDQPDSVLRLNDLSQGIYVILLTMKNGSQQSVKVIKK